MFIPEVSASPLASNEEAAMFRRIKLRYVTTLMMILLAIVVIAFN